jgi:hypothetical protein
MEKKFYLTAVCALLVSVGALAQRGNAQSTFTEPREVVNRSEWKPHVALLVGHTDPEGRGNASPEFAIDVGYQPYIPYGLAVEFSHTRFDDGLEVRDRNILWGKGTYHLSGTIPVIRDSYAGVAVGVVSTPDETTLAAAPLIGFDIPLFSVQNDSAISLGASAKYAVVSGNELDALSLNGVIKYWY